MRLFWLSLLCNYTWYHDTRIKCFSKENRHSDPKKTYSFSNKGYDIQYRQNDVLLWKHNCSEFRKHCRDCMNILMKQENDWKWERLVSYYSAHCSSLSHHPWIYFIFKRVIKCDLRNETFFFKYFCQTARISENMVATYLSIHVMNPQFFSAVFSISIIHSRLTVWIFTILPLMVTIGPRLPRPDGIPLSLL